jgi:signal transduction histidine kinase
MRRRIVTLAVTTATLAIILFGIPLALGMSYYFRLHERADLLRVAYAVASAAPDNLVSGVRLDALGAADSRDQVSLYDRSGRLVSGPGVAHGESLVHTAIEGRVGSSTTGDRLAVTVPVGDGGRTIGAVLVTASAYDRAEILYGWLALGGLAAAVLVIAWAVARRLSRRLAAPLERLAAHAEMLGDGRPVPHREWSGVAEVDSVHRTMVRSAARLERLRERERAFATDASHQLRTPLTRLFLTLDSALAAPDPTADIKHSLAIVSRLDETVTDVLRLAGGDAPAETIAPERLLDDANARWDAAKHDMSRRLHRVTIPGAPAGRASAHAVRQIIDVLIDNAAEHGTGDVTVTVRDAQGALAIDVSQEGPPMQQSAQELFSGQLGLGLRFARKLATACGARLIFSSPDPTTFTLVIPTEHPADTTGSDPGGRDVDTDHPAEPGAAPPDRQLGPERRHLDHH